MGRQPSVSEAERLQNTVAPAWIGLTWFLSGAFAAPAAEHEAASMEPPLEDGCAGIYVGMAMSNGSSSALAPVNSPRFWNGRGYGSRCRKSVLGEPSSEDELS